MVVQHTVNVKVIGSNPIVGVIAENRIKAHEVVE